LVFIKEVYMAAENSDRVIIMDVKMPFISMVIFMVKAAIAAIPAIIILAILGAIIATVVGGIGGVASG
jgi:hypothetical protein